MEINSGELKTGSVGLYGSDFETDRCNNVVATGATFYSYKRFPGFGKGNHHNQTFTKVFLDQDLPFHLIKRQWDEELAKYLGSLSQNHLWNVTFLLDQINGLAGPINGIWFSKS